MPNNPKADDELLATAEFCCRPSHNRDYVVVAVTPKGRETTRYRLSLGGAGVLAAELTSATPPPSDELLPSEERAAELERRAREVEGDSDSPLRVAAADRLWDEGALANQPGPA